MQFQSKFDRLKVIFKETIKWISEKSLEIFNLKLQRQRIGF